MQLEMLYPKRGPVALGELQAQIARGQVARPFDVGVVDACADLSQRLLRNPGGRRYPELLALAFWMRKAELHRLRQQFDLLQRDDRLLVPCGTVFHLPPRNVDTMFVYSWLLSALTGNCNVIRLSRERSESTGELLRLFCEALEHAAPAAREGTWIVSYGHEDEPTCNALLLVRHASDLGRRSYGLHNSPDTAFASRARNRIWRPVLAGCDRIVGLPWRRGEPASSAGKAVFR